MTPAALGTISIPIASMLVTAQTINYAVFADADRAQRAYDHALRVTVPNRYVGSVTQGLPQYDYPAVLVMDIDQRMPFFACMMLVGNVIVETVYVVGGSYARPDGDQVVIALAEGAVGHLMEVARSLN